MNKKIKKLFIKFIILTELFIFSFTFIFGKNGLLYLINLRQQNHIEEAKLELLKIEIKNLNQKINEWNNDEFYKEKIAREQLQLSKEKEQIYFFN